MKSFVEADLDGGEEIMAATDNETLARNGWIAGREEVDDLVGW